MNAMEATMAETKFYKCKNCADIVLGIEGGSSQFSCCEQVMELLVPNTVDASFEKHVPVVTTDGAVMTVKVGSAPHPMIPEHYIEFIYLETSRGDGVLHKLKPGEEPEAVIDIGKLDPVAAYAYCNIHGLWMAEL